jgi:hypothetical protein
LPEKSKELANLARISKLKEEPGTPGEIKGLLTSGTNGGSSPRAWGTLNSKGTVRKGPTYLVSRFRLGVHPGTCWRNCPV